MVSVSLVGGVVAAHARADAGDELLGLEGLDDVVVGTGLQPHDHVDGVALGRQHHDRDAGLGADLLADVDAVLAGEHQVEQDQVGTEAAEGFEGLVAARDDPALEAFLAQHDGQHLGERRIVVDHQNAAPRGLLGHGSHRRQGQVCLSTDRDRTCTGRRRRRRGRRPAPW